YLWKRSQTPDPPLEAAKALGIPVLREEEDADFARLHEAVRQAEIIVDALLGTGAKGPLRGSLPSLLGCVKEILTQRRPTRREGLFQTVGVPLKASARPQGPWSWRWICPLG
ncbi:MAG: hypothetical protein H5T66_11940, partial [Chloroflexi bacterium]|nr:hypothetical protein [Chloroflexota bacterium]